MRPVESNAGSRHELTLDTDVDVVLRLFGLASILIGLREGVCVTWRLAPCHLLRVVPPCCAASRTPPAVAVHATTTPSYAGVSGLI